MKLLYIILGLLCGLLGLALSIMPFGPIALVPIILGFVFGILAFKQSKKENANANIIKVIFLLVIVGLGITIYRAIFDENVVANDAETIQKDKDALEDAKEDLEGIEIDN